MVQGIFFRPTDYNLKMNTKLQKDMMGRMVKLPTYPKRIVSLVPSQTELLYDLGLNKQVVGITKFCIKPTSWFKTKTRVGGTKNINFETIRALQPDLIIGNKEENSQKDIELLEKEFTVWMSDINTYQEALTSIKEIATICKKQQQGETLVQQIEAKRVAYAQKINTSVKSPTVLYFIWQNPWMVVGKNTFINDMISLLGFRNIYQETRYKEITKQEIETLNPDYIFLSSEPYPFKAKHQIKMQKLFPNTTVKLVDGETFSWYGSRLLQAFKPPF